MDIKSLSDKRNKLIADAQAIMQGESVTAEQRGQFDAMLADVKIVDADIARLSAVEQAKAETRSISTPTRPNPGESADPEERAEVRSARQKASFRKFITTGQVETRDLTFTGAGAVVVPQAFDAEIISAQKSYGELYNIVNVMKTDGGEPMKVALDDDTSNGLTLVTTGTDAIETDPTVSSKLLQVSPYTTGVVKVGFDLLSDAGFDLEGWLRDKFGKRFFRGASSLIYNGDGGNVDALATKFATGITSATTATLAYPDFASAIGVLDPAYQQNAVWAMSNATLAYVIGMKDAQNRPLFLPYNDGGTAGFVGTILGKPVKLVTQMPNVATGNAAVLLGDFKSAYSFRQVNPGLGVIRLNERYAASYEVGFVGFARVGGLATIPSAANPAVQAIVIK